MTPFITIHPQYAPPPIVSALPTNAAPLNMRFGDIRLVGYEAPDARYAPGDSLPITLYWQPEAHTEGDFSLSLKAMTSDGTLVGHIDTFPGWGSVRTSTWQTGVIYADHYLLPLNVDARGCSPLRVEVRWWRYPHGIYLPTEVNGEAEDAVFLPVGVFNDGSLLPPLENLNEVHPVDFDNTFRLLGYQVRETSLTLLWETLRIPQADDTVFVQMLNGNTIVAQGDAPPPIPTRYLIVGERFATQHYLNVPPNQGDYPLYIGWYNETQRLPTNSPDYAYPLFSVRFSLTQP
jgi:hypothetical protein